MYYRTSTHIPNRAVQVTVVEDDERGLAAQLERYFLQVGVGTGAHDGLSDLRAAGEAQLAHQGVSGDGITRLGTCEKAGDVKFIILKTYVIKK